MERFYGELAVDDREHIELHYREHRNLHDYMPEGLATAEQFIAQHWKHVWGNRRAARSKARGYSPGCRALCVSLG